MKTLNRINDLFNSNLKGAKRMTKKSTKQYTKRGMIKQLLDRKTLYRVSDYQRKLRKATGKQYTEQDILSSLHRMEKELQLRYWIIDNKIVGFTR